MEMSKVRNVVLVPTALLVVAGVLLIVLLIRAQVVLAPTPTTYHGSSNPAPISQQTITANGSTTPLAPAGSRRAAAGLRKHADTRLGAVPISTRQRPALQDSLTLG